MNKRLLFIYNRKAGRNLLTPHLGDVIDTFAGEGYTVTVHPTQARDDARIVTEQVDENEFDLIVCSGGDGTLDEVVNGMMNRPAERRIPIGYIPAGTTNDFANSLRIPTKLKDAAENAVKGVPFACDAGQFNDKYFVYVAAFGLFTDVSYDTNQDLKNLLGHAAYILEGMRRLSAIRAFEITVDTGEETFTEKYIYGMVTNSRSVGGFRNMINKQHVVFDDGEFEVTLIHMPKNPLEFNEIISALLIQSFETKYMRTFSAKSIRFHSAEPVSWTLDGEYGGEFTDVEIRNRKQELTLLVPEDKVTLISEMHRDDTDTLARLQQEADEERGAASAGADEGSGYEEGE